MFLQNMVMRQRYQPKELPTKKQSFQVGPYRMDQNEARKNQPQSQSLTTTGRHHNKRNNATN